MGNNIESVLKKILYSCLWDVTDLVLLFYITAAQNLVVFVARDPNDNTDKNSKRSCTTMI